MSIVPSLQEIPLFSEVAQEPLARLTDLLKYRTLQFKEILFRQGLADGNFYIVTGGTLRVYRVDDKGNENVVPGFTVGESFGVASLILTDVHDVTAEAAQPSQVVYLNHQDFVQVGSEFPEFMAELNIPESVLQRLQTADFPEKQPGEYTLVMTRRHPWALFRNLIPPVLYIVLLALTGIGLAVSLPSAPWVVIIFLPWRTVRELVR